MQVVRLVQGQESQARATFAMMAAVFEEPCEPLHDDYVRRLLANPEFWAIAAIENGTVVGGITAYALSMTRRECSELFVYDVAVRADRQRRGIGRALMNGLCAAAANEGIRVSFVAADKEDEHAIEFYRSLGGAPLAATFFTFST